MCTSNSTETIIPKASIEYNPDTHDFELKEKEEKSKKAQLPFIMLCDVKPNKEGKGMDALRVFNELKQCSRDLVILLKDLAKYNHVTNARTIELFIVPEDDKEASMIRRGLVELFKKDLIRRTRPKTYIFNPDFFMTNNDEHRALWEATEPHSTSSVN